LIPVVPLAFILPDPLVQPQQRAPGTAADILCAAVAEGRLTLTELDERAGPRAQRSWRSLSAVAWSAGSITMRCCWSSLAAASLM
jgi:hypothetical protein